MILDDKEKAAIEDKCDEVIQSIEWKKNAAPGDCINIERALQSARKGYDGGPEATINLKPKTNSHSSWMNFVHLLTVYYNRDKLVKRYTILRNRIISMIYSACSTPLLRIINCKSIYGP